MTFQQIHEALAAAGKPVSQVQLYRYMRRFGVKPEGALQIPRRYPAQSAATIIAGLGLVPLAAPARATKAGRVLTLKELRTEKRKAGRR